MANKPIVKKAVTKAKAPKKSGAKVKKTVVKTDPLHDVQKTVDAIVEAVEGDTTALEGIVASVEAAEAPAQPTGDAERVIPFDGDKRPIREQVNDHQFLTVLVYVDHDGKERTEWRIGEWQYDWFDSLDEANEWATEVRIWATDDCRLNGDCHYAVAVVETGYPLDIKSVSAHGYVDNKWRLSVCQSITRAPETNLFAEGVTTDAVKPKVPVRKGTAKKGIIEKGNAPTPKASRPTPQRKPVKEEHGVATPIVRSKGFRAKVRGAKGAA